MAHCSYSQHRTVLKVDFAAYARRRGRGTGRPLEFEVKKPFGNEEEVLDQLAAESGILADNLRAAAEKSLKENPCATLATAA